MTTRVASRFLFAGLSLIVCATAPASARAAEPGPDALPLTVVTISTNDADQQADGLTKALRSAVRATPGWSLADGDFGLEVLTIQLKCSDPPDASCQSRIADQIKTDRFIWGQIKKKGNTIHGALHLWVRGKGTTDVPLDYSANLIEANDDALKKIAAEGVKTLTGGPPKGSLHVKSNGVGGQVFLDGEPLGAITTGDATFVVPSGSHRVVVRSAGYADAEAPVTVKPGTTADISLSPTKVEPSKPLDWRLYGGFAGLGLGAIFGTVGIVGASKVSTIKGDPAIDSYRKGRNRYCDDAAAAAMSDPQALYVDQKCKEATGAEVMQAVFFPLAGIAGGVGIFLLATSGTKAPAASTRGSIRVDPYFGPKSGKVDLTLQF